ncbi:MAG TPA: ABC transporter permease [Candidatus Acidoferrum sp.]|nr:ABC transporter permease [Candidatus Acidoferrum sp.]
MNNAIASGARALLSRVRGLFAARDLDSDFAQELEAHLELLIDENIRRGMPPAEAARAAHLKLGGIAELRESHHDQRTLPCLESLGRDVRFGVRMLGKNPGFTMVAVLTVALGIGANTAIFSLIESTLLRPLLFRDADRIVRIYSTKNGALLTPNGSGRLGGPSPMDMRDFAQRNHTFDGMAVYDTWRKNVSFVDSGSEPEQMNVGLMPGSYFEILGINPVMGRLFTQQENQVGRNYVAAISEQLWSQRFGADKAILGRQIRINDEPYTIVAVIPNLIPAWMEATQIQIWTPFAFSDLWSDSARGSRGYGSLARIKQGVSFEQAQADLAVIAADLSASHALDQGVGVSLEKLSDSRARNLRPMLFLLMGAVSLILLIACANLANLLLARNSVRKRELAVRAALGAGRKRLVLQLLVETRLLSLVGGGLGLFLARIGVAALIKFHPADLPQVLSVGVDGRVLAFTIFASVGTSLIFGLGPALAASRSDPIESLKLGSRSGNTGSHGRRMRTILITSEMAMSLMLLVGASLLVQSVMRLERQALGIRQDHLLAGHFYVPGARYPNPDAITRFCDQFADRVRALPGVLNATVTTIYPPNDSWVQMLDIPGHPATQIQDVATARFGVVDSHFVGTLGIPLIRGRDFAESDTATSTPVALISQEFVRRYFPTEDPIGVRIHIGPPQILRIPAGGDIIFDATDVTIVGIIGDFRNSGLASPPGPQIITLYSQHPLVNYGFKDIVIRTAADPHLVIPEVTRQLHALDSDMPFAETRTVDEIIEQNTGSQRFISLLLGLFAVAGLLLAAVGIFGVVSFLTSQRRHEMAIRVAVGASVADILWLVLREGLRTALIGASIGLVGVCAVERLMRGLLFEISPLDPLTIAGAALFLVALVTIACWLPAWRASRVDPLLALRHE